MKIFSKIIGAARRTLTQQNINTAMALAALVLNPEVQKKAREAVGHATAGVRKVRESVESVVAEAKTALKGNKKGE